MSETQTAPAKHRPVVSFLKIPEDGGEPYLEGQKCAACGEIQLAKPVACPSCGARGKLAPVKLANSGKLYNFTVVHRNFPGVPVPFISAIVDLEGGGCLKGNLVDMLPSPEAIKFDMPVNVVFREAPQKDKEGNSYLSYFFVPA